MLALLANIINIVFIIISDFKVFLCKRYIVIKTFMGISIKNMGWHEQHCAYSGCECDITNGLDAPDSSCWTFLWNVLEIEVKKTNSMF